MRSRFFPAPRLPNQLAQGFEAHPGRKVRTSALDGSETMSLHDAAQTVRSPSPHMLVLMEATAALRTHHSAGVEIFLVRCRHNNCPAGSDQPPELPESRIEMLVQDMFDYLYTDQ